MPIVLKSGNLNLLEPSGPVQACNGIALRKQLYLTYLLCNTCRWHCIVCHDLKNEKYFARDIKMKMGIVKWSDHKNTPPPKVAT